MMSTGQTQGFNNSTTDYKAVFNIIIPALFNVVNHYTG